MSVPDPFALAGLSELPATARAAIVTAALAAMVTLVGKAIDRLLPDANRRLDERRDRRRERSERVNQLEQQVERLQAALNVAHQDAFERQSELHARITALEEQLLETKKQLLQAGLVTETLRTRLAELPPPPAAQTGTDKD